MRYDLVRQARARNLQSLPYRLGWRASRDVEALLKEALAPLPAPPAGFWSKAGALLTNAPPADFDLLWQGGFRMLAPQIHWAVGHNETTGKNYNAIQYDHWSENARAKGFLVGGWGLSTGLDTEGEAHFAYGLINQWGLDFYIADTERHKTDLGGSMDWTTSLFGELRWLLGPSFPLGNVTWGINSSPQVINHEAMRKYNVQYLPEAYDSGGHTVSVAMTVEKANGEGWKPAVPVLGDKDFQAGTITLGTLGQRGLVKGFWMWAAEQAQDVGFDSIRAACLNGAAVL